MLRQHRHLVALQHVMTGQLIDSHFLAADARKKSAREQTDMHRLGALSWMDEGASPLADPLVIRIISDAVSVIRN
jgi:hypothetical protein